MKLLVTGTKKVLIDHPLAQYLGVLTSPRTGTGRAFIEATGLVWAADNDAFKRFDAAAYRRFLAKLRDGWNTLEWITAPDVVGDGYATLALWHHWLDALADADEALDIPSALVAQDGMEDLDVDAALGYARALFVGGSTEWKLSRAAADLMREAKARGLWLHMGRVNAPDRLGIAYDAGCDSVDGTGYAIHPPLLEWALAHVERLHGRPPAGWDGQAAQQQLFAA